MSWAGLRWSRGCILLMYDDLVSLVHFISAPGAVHRMNQIQGLCRELTLNIINKYFTNSRDTRKYFKFLIIFVCYLSVISCRHCIFMYIDTGLSVTNWHTLSSTFYGTLLFLWPFPLLFLLVYEFVFLPSTTASPWTYLAAQREWAQRFSCAKSYINA